MVTTRNVVHAALYLVIVLGCSGNLYFARCRICRGHTSLSLHRSNSRSFSLRNHAHWGAFGGINLEEKAEQRKMSILVAGLLVVVTGGALINTFFSDAEIARSSPSTTATVGDSIFSQFIIPFEAVSVLLLAALIGAIVVARKD